MTELFFNKTKFLPHCDLEVHLKMIPNELTVIVGHNGVGKTSFLNFFAKQLGAERSLLLSQKSEPWFYTRKLSVLKKMMRESGLENFNEKTFLNLWDLFKLDDIEDRTTEDLSGGEFQSLRLCMALSRDTEFYLLDEPAHYLDFSRKEVLAKTIEEMLLSNKKIVIVEHDFNWIPSKKNIQQFVIKNGKLCVGESWSI